MPGLIVVNLGKDLKARPRWKLKRAIQAVTAERLPKGRLDIRCLMGSSAIDWLAHRSAIDRFAGVASRDERVLALGSFNLELRIWKQEVAAVVWDETGFGSDQQIAARLLGKEVDYLTEAPRLIWTGSLWHQN